MKRIDEKVKDIVDVRPYESLRDFTENPERTLAGYHFTDATSELMSKWIDKIAGVQGGNGTACALAGYRGVGKSHFLATLGAVAALPELRTKISDSHVAASAQRLLRRHYPVAYVKRGTFDTLLDELRFAIAESLKIDQSRIGATAKEIFDLVASINGELPFVLIIDTALERGERVTRDDGGFLSELAVESADRNLFLGVALDDDIADADGVNASITQTYQIDYLDQDHLYKVVNAHIFPKRPQMQPILRDVYEYFRRVLPDFRWSEHRFSSLYPMHPAILEIAPFVRLHVHDFAMLSFACEAGQHILGRPANSLIALDEVFDSAEPGLRKVTDLAEPFEAFDRLNTSVISKLPVLQRLQAKLILKALLLLSLDGQGATAGEICAGMLIFDEDDITKEAINVANLLTVFSQADAESIEVDADSNGRQRFRFKVSSKDDLNRALAHVIEKDSPESIEKTLIKLFDDRFADATFIEAKTAGRDWIESQAVWRGGLRRGRVIWCGGASEAERQHSSGELVDWEVVIDTTGQIASAEAGGTPRVVWRPAELRADERDAILRYHALSTDQKLRSEFADQIRASLHSHNVTADRIFDRIFLSDGVFAIDGFDYNISDEAKASDDLSDLLSKTLDPLFLSRYAEHPIFAQRLGVNEVATLVTDLYSGNRQYLAEVQRLAGIFAYPLGLVRDQGGAFVPETEENLLKLPLAERILKLVDQNPKEPVLLKVVYTELRRPPHGLAREAQQLILAALVAQRQIEFVTSKGDRINRRSLDLQIIWDDIIGIARPVDASYSAKKLVAWGKVFAGASGFRSLDDLADREILRTAFLKWTSEWRRTRVLEKFNELPDDVLNTRIWNTAARVSATLGAVAENISACLQNSISYEECLARIADSFLDRPESMEATNEQLGVLDSFLRGSELRSQVEAYLALCGDTHVEDLEAMREKLLLMIDRGYHSPSDANNRELGYLWTKFLREFSEEFASHHDAVMKSHDLQEKFDQIMRSDKWSDFNSLASLLPNGRDRFPQIFKMIGELNDLDCQNNVRESLKTRPFCTCCFDLARIEHWRNLPAKLSAALDEGVTRSRTLLAENADALKSQLSAISSADAGQGVADAARSAAAKLTALPDGAPFSPSEVQILARASAKIFLANESVISDKRRTAEEQPARPKLIESDPLLV